MATMRHELIGEFPRLNSNPRFTSTFDNFHQNNKQPSNSNQVANEFEEDLFFFIFGI